MGEVYLPNVTRAWFYNNDGSSKYAPTDEAGGTPFNVRLEDCADNSSIKQLMFSFTPQSGFGATKTRFSKMMPQQARRKTWGSSFSRQTIKLTS